MYSWKRTPFHVVDLRPTLADYAVEMRIIYRYRWLHSSNPNSTWKELKNIPDTELVWDAISKHPNVNWDIIQVHPEKPWYWPSICENPNITWDIIQSHPEKEWHWSTLSKHPNITWDIIHTHPEKEWDWENVLRNPNLTWEIVDAHPEKPWDWRTLSLNPMNQARMQEEKQRIQERCKAIREDLMAAAWHPRRVEKWLNTGGFELLD